MDSTRAPEKAAIPQSLVGALVIAFAFMGFVAWDQHHWWLLKEDYSFGWLVPLFVPYVMWERRAAVAALIEGACADAASRNREQFWRVVGVILGPDSLSSSSVRFTGPARFAVLGLACVGLLI